MPSTAKRYTRAEEAAMRAAGMRPVTIWVPDVSRPGFAEECARQSRLAAEADKHDPTIDSFLEAAWIEMNKDLSETEK